ncbi:MAG: quinolinate synthase NadA [Anaerovoracaceae bacterium]|jgi:quinolinate synthase
MQNLIKSILELKKERGAAILAHYYVDGPVQEIADYVGDSYYLSKIATGIHNEVILLCGVRFMGESVKILNPEKTVLMPDPSADCPMAHMAQADEIARVRAEYEDLAVVCYINSTAQIKALSDVCVTSSNAKKVVSALEQKNIFFVPDKNLGAYIASLTPEKNFILNDGHCYAHNDISPKDIQSLLNKHPDAKVLAHPECGEKVLKMAEYVGSTSGIIDYATDSRDREFIICTEHGILHQLKKKNPNKDFFFTEHVPICHDMKKNTLENVRQALANMDNAIELDEMLRTKAEVALKRMHEIAD